MFLLTSMAISNEIPCDPCADDCTSEKLGAWANPECLQSIQTPASEIESIYLSDCDADGNPVGGTQQFADAAFATSIVDSGDGWRCLCGIGSFGEPNDTTKALPKGVTKIIRREWEMTFDIYDVSKEHWDTAADSFGKCSWSGRMAYTTADVIFADKDGNGIPVTISAVPVFNTGRDECIVIRLTIKWEGLCWPTYVGENPFKS